MSAPQPRRTEGGPSGPRPHKKFTRKRKFCRFCADKVLFIDYKDMKLLKSHLTDRGKILPRRMTGVCAGHQRELTTAIMRARNIALLSLVER